MTEAWDVVAPWLLWFWNSPLSTLAGLLVGFWLLLAAPRPIERPAAPQSLDIAHDGVLWVHDRGHTHGPLCPKHRMPLLFTNDQKLPPHDSRHVADQDLIGTNGTNYFGSLWCVSCRQTYTLSREDWMKRVSASRIEAATLALAQRRAATLPG